MQILTWNVSSMLTASQFSEAKRHRLGTKSSSCMLLGLSLLLGNTLSACWNKQAALFCVLGSSQNYLLGPCLGRWLHTVTSCLWHTVTSLSYTVSVTFFCYKLPPFLPDSGKVEIITGLNLKGCTERVREVYLLGKITWYRIFLQEHEEQKKTSAYLTSLSAFSTAWR